jgi:hypothetical protein
VTYRREPAPHDSWTAEQWEELRDRAAAYLATDPGWIVGPAVVAQAEGRIRALRAVSCPA